MICCQDIQAFFKIKVHKISRTKFLLKGKNVTSQSTKNKKVKIKYLFWVPTCQAPPNPTTYHTMTHLFIPLAGSLPHFSFLSFLLFFIFDRTLSLLLQALLPAPPNHHFHHHFSSKITRKFLRTHKHLHILFLR